MPRPEADLAADKAQDVVEMGSAFDEALNDVGGDLNELKGILSEALGDLPFKIALIFIVLYNFLYTLYGSYFGTNVSHMIESDCYCNRSDRLFYRIITIGFSTAWIIFLVTYGIYTTLFHSHIVRGLLRADDVTKEMERQYEGVVKQINRRKKYLNSQLEEFLTTAYLDTDYFKAKKSYLTMLYNKKPGETTASDKIRENPKQIRKQAHEDEDKNDGSSRQQPKKWCCFMVCKILLLILRFAFRILIVPLLQLQWINDYAWNCIMGDFLRDYCETVFNTNFITLDHSLVIYSVYVLILVALLFSVVLNWLPKGVPQVVFQYEESGDARIFQQVIIAKKATKNY